MILLVVPASSAWKHSLSVLALTRLALPNEVMSWYGVSTSTDVQYVSVVAISSAVEYSVRAGSAYVRVLTMEALRMVRRRMPTRTHAVPKALPHPVTGYLSP